jgi:hypothetical protein
MKEQLDEKGSKKEAFLGFGVAYNECRMILSKSLLHFVSNCVLANMSRCLQSGSRQLKSSGARHQHYICPYFNLILNTEFNPKMQQSITFHSASVSTNKSC